MSEAGCSEEEAWEEGRMKEFCGVYWRVVEGGCEARIVGNGEEFGEVREVVRMAVRWIQRVSRLKKRVLLGEMRKEENVA